MEERTAPHIGQLTGVTQLPQHGHRVGGLTSIGQAKHGPPDRPMGWPVEVGLLEHSGDLGQQPSGGQDGPEDGLLGLKVVRWLPVGVGHRSQPSPGRWPARFRAGHRRGLRGPLPRRRDAGVGRRWSRMCLT
jgi:hypothetical protein